MLTFKQFVAELAREDVSITPAELKEMTARFGSKVLQMGHLQDDGSMLVPVDCIVEAAHSLGSRHLAQAADALQSDQIVAMLQSAEEFVELVSESRKRKLEQMVERFQAEPNDGDAHHQWKNIEKMVFGVEYKD